MNDYFCKMWLTKWAKKRIIGKQLATCVCMWCYSAIKPQLCSLKMKRQLVGFLIVTTNMIWFCICHIVRTYQPSRHLQPVGLQSSGPMKQMQCKPDTCLTVWEEWGRRPPLSGKQQDYSKQRHSVVKMLNATALCWGNEVEAVRGATICLWFYDENVTLDLLRHYPGWVFSHTYPLKG